MATVKISKSWNRFLVQYTTIKNLIKIIRLIKNPFPLIQDYFRLNKNNPYTIYMKKGHKYQLRAGSSDRFILCENYVINDYFGMGQYFRSGDVVVDVGANFGCFSIQASQYNPKIVYSIEPSVDNYNLLKKNIALNKINNISVHNIAIGGFNGTIKLFKNSEKSAFHSIFANIEGRSQTLYEYVNIKTLESFFKKNNIDYCNYLKMDCEGAEHDILNCDNLDFFKKIEQITLEIHEVNGQFIDDIIEKLKKLGYEIISIRWRVVYARRKC